MNNSCYDIYGNINIKNTISSMIKNEHLSHAFLIFGEKGLGKKTIARYISGQILCEMKNGEVWGTCKACKMIAHDSHPDVKWIFHNSTSKGFSVSNLREIVVDAYIKPNDSDKKIYIFADCDTMLPVAQNALLKLIEEPPPHAVFIFTATSKSVFLPTIISRVISFGASEVSLEECKTALLQKSDENEEKTSDAIEAFGGNIGMCLEYLHSDELINCVSITKSIIDNFILRSEYNLVKTMCELDGKKERTKTVVFLLSNVIRDCCAIKTGSNILISCYKDGAQKLAQIISLKLAQKIYDILTQANQRIDKNANLSLTLTNISCQIKEIF